MSENIFLIKINSNILQEKIVILLARLITKERGIIWNKTGAIYEHIKWTVMHNFTVYSEPMYFNVKITN